MTLHSGTPSQKFVRFIPVTAVLILLGLIAPVTGGAAPKALDSGTIHGKVTATGGAPLPNTQIHFYDMLADNEAGPTGVAVTDAQGDYSINLPPSTYAFFTQNTLGYINEIWDNIPCSAVCDPDSLVPVVLSNGANITANFALDPGGRIAGRITDSVTGLGIPNVTVNFLPSTGDIYFSTAVTDANGDYISEGGTVTGTAFAYTVNTLGYINEVWDNVKCGECDVTVVGTPMPVTIGVINGGFNFALDHGATITGTVRDTNLAPLANIEISILDSNSDSVAFGVTDASGHYVSGGMLAGNYYVRTNNALGLVDKIWNNIPCAGGNCSPAFVGATPIAVTTDNETGNINFVLQPGGRITGTITNAVGGGSIGTSVFVSINDAAGLFIGGGHSDSGTGNYAIRGLPPGTYYVNIFNVPGFFNQMYNNLTCTTNCNILQSTPIHVAANVTTPNINFALVPTSSVGSISGTVRDVTLGAPGTVVNNIVVQLFNATGANIAGTTTNASGVYTFSNLPVASYYVRTNGAGGLINQLHNGVFCNSCNVTTSGGTPIPVTAATTATINFNLTTGGRISGTITNAFNGTGINAVTVQVFNAAGVMLVNGTTISNGQYTTRALPDGTYYLRTTNTGGFVDKVYDNVSCIGPACTIANGTPVVVAGTAIVPNKNFALSAGGRITGTVTNAATGQPIGFGVSIQVFNDVGSLVGSQATDNTGTGNYTTFSLPTGRYYIRTTNSGGFQDELYDNIPCSIGCTVTTGAPVDVVALATASGKNFALGTGGNIAGTVRDANTNVVIPGVRVGAYLADGTAVRSNTTNANGEYSMVGMAPGTYYLRTSIVNGPFYLDELYNELPCAPTCTLTAGEAIVVTAGVTENARNFTLAPGGGAVSGTVRDAATNAILSGVQVQLFLPDGTNVKTVGSNSLGAFSANLPAGTYRARTNVASAADYLDELFSNGSCTPTCNVAAGASIVVADGATNSTVDFTLSPNLVHNGRFDGAFVNWVLFSTPDLSYIQYQLTNGVFEYYRVPPAPGTANQAVIFQETGKALAAGAPLIARFSIGNTSSVRKRISVLVLDSDFSDLAVCTFWLAPNAPRAPYEMRTHTTKTWTSAALYFYAASAGSNGGFYQLDEVSLESAPTESATRTQCVDPTRPVAPGGPDSAEMLVNGNFNTGQLTPWFTFGQISSQINAGVFEFIKLAGAPAGVVSQFTGLTASANDIVTATFQLGNSSTVRKRVTVILGDSNFSDLSACTFWLPPSTPLSNYAYRTFATQAWANASISVYPATTGPDQWIRLDNVSFKRTPSTTIAGTECLEPGSAWAPDAAPLGEAPQSAAVSAAGDAASHDGWRAGGFVPAGDGSSSAWIAVASGNGPYILQRASAIDLSDATSARLTFWSWLTGVSRGEVQVRGSGGEWTSMLIVGASDTWTPISVDLSAYLGQVIEVRFVYYPVAGGDAPDTWRVNDVSIDVGRTPIKYGPPR